MRKDKSPQRLQKLLLYILSRRPDEFGLIPDSEGFLPIKSLFAALHEDEELRYVRKSHVDEVFVSIPDHGLERVESKIRAIDRSLLPQPVYEDSPPGEIYTCVRAKGYPVAADKGVAPARDPYVVLAADKERAVRMGKRRDPSPVLLRVQTGRAQDLGVVFHRFGEGLFLADFLPPDCFTGPSLPKEKPEEKKAAKPAQKMPDPAPGSFFLDFSSEEEREAERNRRRKKEKDIKKGRKEQRKEKERDKWNS